jgi:uncharacterized protein with NRDE domain
MCLIAFAFTPGQDRHLLLAANRDEFHERPARPLTWWDWPEGPLAGRDVQAGGTWLAVARDGRWAAVTNVRDPRAGSGPRSRGDLPVGFLRGRLSPAEYVEAVHSRRSEYGPFNLLAGDRDSLWYGSSHADPRPIDAGVHALSNGLIDEPWPKSRRVAQALGGLVRADAEFDGDRLLGLMDDREPASDGELPDTGVGIEMERWLSSPFIVSERYGTRCSTALSLGRRCRVVERSFDSTGQAVTQVEFGFTAVCR